MYAVRPSCFFPLFVCLLNLFSFVSGVGVRVVRFPGAGVAGGCEVTHMGAGSQTQVLDKRQERVLLSLEPVLQPLLCVFLATAEFESISL